MTANGQDTLVDIQDVMKELRTSNQNTQAERMQLFIQKIKNPYMYKVGDVTVNISFANQMSIDECFANFLASI